MATALRRRPKGSADPIYEHTWIVLGGIMRAKLAILCCIVSATPWFAQDNARRDDEAAIREVVSKYVDARERVDPKAVEELFTSDADQLVSSGEWRKGRDAVVRGTMESSRNRSEERRVGNECRERKAPGRSR